MTNEESKDEQTTEIFFAVELTNQGAINIYPNPVEWKDGTHFPTLPEIADLSARVAKELDRHLIVDQLSDKIESVITRALEPSEPVPFSQKLVEALKDRGITPDDSVGLVPIEEKDE